VEHAVFRERIRSPSSALTTPATVPISPTRRKSRPRRQQRLTSRGAMTVQVRFSQDESSFSFSCTYTSHISYLVSRISLTLSFNSGFLLSVLLIALDQTIVATALPRIASDFDALDQLTWIVSAYFRKSLDYSHSYHPFDPFNLPEFSHTGRPHAHLWPIPHHRKNKVPLPRRNHPL